MGCTAPSFLYKKFNIMHIQHDIKDGDVLASEVMGHVCGKRK